MKNTEYKSGCSAAITRTWPFPARRRPCSARWCRWKRIPGPKKSSVTQGYAAFSLGRLRAGSVPASHNPRRPPLPATRWPRPRRAPPRPGGKTSCRPPRHASSFTFAGTRTTSPAAAFGPACPTAEVPAAPGSAQWGSAPPPLAARWICQLFRQPGSKVTLPITTPSADSISK